MAETCIVCLGDLRVSVDTDPPPPEASVAASPEDGDASRGEDAKKIRTRANAKSIKADEEAIAHLLPCKHDLHNACLTPWVERANSCPICRAKFNVVELSKVVGGPVVDSYAVQDKIQEAELDPTMIVEEDELFAVEAWEPTWEPCVVCNVSDEQHETMYCDGCEKVVHVFCAGYDEAPAVWYCESCLADLESDVGLPGLASVAQRRQRRRLPRTQPRGSRRNDAIWARVWQEVSRRLDIDLDFPFDDEPSDQRTDEQRREFARWQRRFEVASQQGAANRLRGIANARLQDPEPVTRPAPDSQEVLRAWNAFDKARESQDAPASIRTRKRKRTASPASSSHEPEPTEAQPQQKRPRLRRPPITSEPQQSPESSHAAVYRNGDGPTFLSSLLHEVESKPISASSPSASEQHNGQYSPRDSSPVSSPPSSECATPRRLSATPPPRGPISTPLSSTVVPLSSPTGATFSPFSPTDTWQKLDASAPQRGRRWNATRSQPESDEEAGQDRASSTSPSRSLSYSAKEEIQRMVKLALGSRYRDKEITKDQYTDINRDVSRKLYDLVGSASALADQSEREKWQEVADEEVKKAITALSAVHISDDDDKGGNGAQ